MCHTLAPNPTPIPIFMYPLVLLPSSIQATSFWSFLSIFGFESVLVEMGLSNFPSAAEGLLPVLLMNTVLSVALLMKMVRSVLQVVGASGNYGNEATIATSEEDPSSCYDGVFEQRRSGRISITRYESLCRNRSHSGIASNSNSNCNCNSNIIVNGVGVGRGGVECCVCLCRFEADEEVSELSCKHFFHKGCLEKWFDNQHITCPLCRSIL